MDIRNALRPNPNIAATIRTTDRRGNAATKHLITLHLQTANIRDSRQTFPLFWLDFQQQNIPFTLVISLRVIMDQVFTKRSPQRGFTEQDQLR
jgi:hypothetical protein